MVFENLLAEQIFKVHFLLFEMFEYDWETYLFDAKL